MIVVIAGEKGGTGKTTIATNLAIIRAQNASDVLLIDSDPQNSSLDFSKARELEAHQPEITCMSITGTNTASEIRRLEPKFDDIVVDVGGRDSSTLRSALLAADILVVPFLPSQLDAWGLENMDKVVEELRTHNQRLKTLVFLNKVDTNPRVSLTEDAIKFASDLKSLTFSNITIGYRIAYRRAVAEGLAVTELSRKDPKAVEEMKKLYKEVFQDA